MKLQKFQIKNLVPEKYHSSILFFFAFLMFALSRTSVVIPQVIPRGLAMLIAPVFILRFSRTVQHKRAGLIIFTGFLLSANIALWFLFDLGDFTRSAVYSLIRSSMIAVIFFLPYLVDKKVYPKFAGTPVLSTLIFPMIVTTVMFLVSLDGPFDGIMLSGVYHSGPLFFRQLGSIAGASGFVFIFSWFASVMNHLWENSVSWKKIRNTSLVFSSVLVAICLYGTIKISPLMLPHAKKVKIASVLYFPHKEVKQSLFFTRDVLPYEKTMNDIEKIVKTAASNGAKIITTQETITKVRDTDEEKLLTRVKDMAYKNNVFISFAYSVLPEKTKGWNKHILVSNKKELLINYNKRFLFGFDFGPASIQAENSVYNKGAEIIQVADTPYGRIAASICKDMEFSRYIRQAGLKNADIMLCPSYDIAIEREPENVEKTIEFGFSLVRPNQYSLSHAHDFNGRMLGKMDFDRTEDGILYIDVPTRGMKTIYTIIGDLLAWICMTGTTVFIVFAIFQKKAVNSRI